MTKEEFKEYYKKEGVTSTYDTQREGNEYRKQKRQKELQIFLGLLDKKDEDKVLELGCSSGFLTQHLGKVTAVDTSFEMLNITKKKNPKAKCMVADMFKLPFGNKLFDKVVTMRVWNHLDELDLMNALREVKRVLKKDGCLVFDLEEFSTLRIIINFFYKKIFKITGYKTHRYKLGNAVDIINNEGFGVKEIKFLKHRIGRQMIFQARKE